MPHGPPILKVVAAIDAKVLICPGLVPSGLYIYINSNPESITLACSSINRLETSTGKSSASSWVLPTLFTK